MANAELMSRVRGLGRRLLAIGLGAGFAWGVGLAAIVVLLGVWFDLVVELSGSIRIAILVSAGFAGLVALAILLGRSIVRARPLALARRMDAATEAQGRIACGVDFATHPQGWSPLTAGLAELAVADAADWASRTPSGKAAPTRPLLVPTLIIFAIGVVVALVAATAPRLALAQYRRFFDPLGDHPPYSPLALDVQPGDTRVVFGQAFDVRVTATGAPVERIDLVLKNAAGEDAVLPMYPETGELWRATVVNVVEPARYFVRSGRARSDKFQLDVVTVPQLANVKFRVTPPAYTHRAPYEGPLPKEGLAGLPGTRVEAWATSNRPLSGGAIDVFSTPNAKPTTVAMSAVSEGSNEARGEFMLAQSGKLELRVVDADGQRSTDVFTAPIQRLVDERPFVRIVEPREISFATPTATLPVVVSAEDDYGISRLQLFRALNGSRALPLELTVPKPAPLRLEPDTVLPLSSYGVRAGDEIQLFARVEDTNPAGPLGAESPVVTIRVIDQADYERMIRREQGLETLQAKYQQAERRMEALAEEIAKLQKKLEQTPKDSPLADAQRKELEQLAKRLHEEAEAMKSAAKQTLPYDIDKELSKELEKLANSLAKAAKECEGLAKPGACKAGKAAEQLKKLQEQLARDRKEFDREAQQPVGDLAKAYKLIEAEARFIQLYQRQRDLAQRLDSLRGTDAATAPADRVRMRDLETEQSSLREELRRLLDDIEANAEQLPEREEFAKLRETAQKFAADLRESGAAEAMTECESGLAEFSGKRGAAGAKNAADILEKFIARCEGGESMCEQCNGALKFQPKLSKGLGNSLKQMLADAGFNLGRGQGSGAGGQAGAGYGPGGARDGYSMRRDTARNVGLYGNLPTAPQSSGAGFGNQRQGAGRQRYANVGAGHNLANTVESTTGARDWVVREA